MIAPLNRMNCWMKPTRTKDRPTTNRKIVNSSQASKLTWLEKLSVIICCFAGWVAVASTGQRNEKYHKTNHQWMRQGNSGEKNIHCVACQWHNHGLFHCHTNKNYTRTGTNDFLCYITKNMRRKVRHYYSIRRNMFLLFRKN